jgi:glycine betaine/choline ABC-type transport system substrate-binding protein
MDRYGSALGEALDSVTRNLDLRALIELNTQVAAGAKPADVASEWLAANRITAFEEASP